MSESAIRPVDLTNCDREPIHLLGAVQPFGFLIAVSITDWRIARASANVAEWLRLPAADLVGRPLQSVFRIEAVDAVRFHLQSAVMGDTTARTFGLEVVEGLACDVAVHLSDGMAVIECERSTEPASPDAAATVRGMVAKLGQTEDDRAFYRTAAREMRNLTGFDRVMIYRFDIDGSGEVVAEAARSGLESYLGLHYPASDIPRQARILYERNWLRIIPDVGAAPAPVVPARDAEGKPLDLSLSVLRSVSAIHIEYLRNMGVQASMSVSILRQGKLWGLFACHHYAPHHVGFGRRTAAELFGQMFSLMMENREREAEGIYEIRAQRLHQRIVSVMASESRQFESIVAHLEDIADLLACDGIGLCMGESAILQGKTPDPAQFARLIDHLKGQQVVDIHARAEIKAEHPEAVEYAEQAAGMLVVPLSRPARDYLVFFRQEAARNVSWAGDPAKPVTVGPLGERLTPRKSFELWKETVRGRAQEWKPVECRIAENLRVSLLEVILRLTDLTVEERRRAQEKQELLIAELNHRIRNILGLIRGVISQSKDSEHTVDTFTSVVGGRIQALARAHDQITADRWSSASFRSLIAAEAGAYLGEKAQRVLHEGPDALVAPDAFTTLALVLHEMITNSAKYGALSDRRGRVEIKTAIDPAGRYVIGWREFDGPPVKPPTRRGFGSTVIERSIAHNLKGEAEVEFAPDGLRAEFIIPSVHIGGPGAPPAPAPEPPDLEGDAGWPMPQNVLLVEDNLIIALDTELMLQELGCRSVQVASSVAAALDLLDEATPDFALLDVNLGDESSFPIADRLAEAGVPFAFTTGYGEQAAFPDRYAPAPKVAKPYNGESLRGVLAAPR